MHHDSDQWPRRLGILGVGLLGGSVALAVRKARPHVHVAGLARTEQSAARLIELGIVDDARGSLEEVCRDCDVVVVATPVDQIADLAIRTAELTGPDCLITDVGSTKAGIVQAIAGNAPAASKFVAAHPIAGSEKTGAQHALATLVEQKVIVLTPGPSTPSPLLERAVEFWNLTGGVIRQMSAEQHDAHLAAVSHVPHLVSALVARMPDSDAFPLVGSGWQDITRVAAGDPGMWTAICQENRQAIIDELERFSGELDRLRHLLQSGDNDQLMAWLTEAKLFKQQSM